MNKTMTPLLQEDDILKQESLIFDKDDLELLTDNLSGQHKQIYDNIGKKQAKLVGKIKH